MINRTYKPIQLILFLFFSISFNPASLQADTVQFTPDDSIILNPERGLMKYMVVGPGSFYSLAGLRNDNHTLAWGLIFLDDYRTTSVLPEQKLNEITNWLDEVRANKVKTVLRVLYHQVESFNPPGAKLDIQRAHMRQLGERVLRPYKDVILALQAGGIGAYGEWYYAPPEITTGTARKQLLDSMFEASADDALVMVRLPHHKLQYESLGADTSRVNRTAHYNDCFLSNELDTGTYICTPAVQNCPSPDQLKNKVANDSLSVLVGGETCNSSPRNDCPGVLAGMQQYGWSFINTLYYSDSRARWEAQGCFDQITKQLGYRFELVEATVPDSIAPGSNFQVSVTVKNVGWAPMYLERPVFIRMTDDNDQELGYFFTGADARDWKPGGQSYTFEADVTAPPTINSKTVSLSLWLPDNDPRHYRTPEYSVQMANANVWNPIAGDNLLAETLPVGAAQTCDQSVKIPSATWMLLSLPCISPTESSVADLFADDVLVNGAKARYGVDWIVYTFDSGASSRGQYVNPGLNGTLKAAQGFWFIQLTGKSIDLDMPNSSQPIRADSPARQACGGGNGCVNYPLTGNADEAGRWHIAGNPSITPVRIPDMRISTANNPCQGDSGGCSITQASTAGLVLNALFAFDGENFVNIIGQPTLDAWRSVWIKEQVGAAGESPVLHWPLASAN